MTARARTFEREGHLSGHGAVGAPCLAEPAVPVPESRLRHRAGDVLSADRWLVGAAAGEPAAPTSLRALRVTLDAFQGHPGLALWMMAIADVLSGLHRHTQQQRIARIGGLAHAAAHFVATFYVGWGARDIATAGSASTGSCAQASPAMAIFAGGWVVGSLVVGLYLLISVNVFGRHSEEAFSGLRIEDYKHFLRLHIDRRRRR